MSKLSALLPIFFFFAGCNPYTQSYTDLTGGMAVARDPNYISSGKPELVYGGNIKDDCKKMRENGYALLGVSNFNGSSANQSMALEQAKKVNADTVIVYSEYIKTVTEDMPLTVPNTWTPYPEYLYGSEGGYGNYYGSPIYGTRTIYIPHEVRKYDYYASFWAKSKPPLLGIGVDDLTDELRRKIGSNKGVYIVFVVKGSPAFDNDLLAGDIIRKINGEEVIDTANFRDIAAANKGKPIEIEILRNGKTILKQIQPD
jgi:hypothetical protein